MCGSCDENIKNIICAIISNYFYKKELEVYVGEIFSYLKIIRTTLSIQKNFSG